MTLTRAQHIETFLARHGHGAAALHPLAGDASFRRYIRVRSKGESLMLMDAPPDKEDVRPYIAIAGALRAAGYSAPEIIAQDADAGLLLLEDLGDSLFTPLLAHGQADEETLYAAAIDVLAQWPRTQLPDAVALPVYDPALLLRELRLFSEWYLPQVAGSNAAALGEDFIRLWETLLAQTPLRTDCFIHRDYHADNLLWLPERDKAARVGLLDFQDAVQGDPAYDLVSLLEDARRDVPPALAEAMLARYLRLTSADAQRLRTAYAVLGAQRNCKIIGIFARLSQRDGKHGYLRYLPRVWRHLEQDVAHPELAALREWLERYVQPEWRGYAIAPIDS